MPVVVDIHYEVSQWGEGGTNVTYCPACSSEEFKYNPDFKGFLRDEEVAIICESCGMDVTYDYYTYQYQCILIQK